MALATLSIDLVAKLADLEQGFNRAASLADKTAGRMESAFGGLEKKLGQISKNLIGMFAVREMVQFVNDVNEGVAALEDLSTATGASVENLSALEDVGRRTGNTFDTVANTLVKFNKGLEGAKAGDDVSRIFDALGLSVKELKQLDPAEALRRTAVALEGFANDGEKARAVQVLFGKSVREMAPFLKDLASQMQLQGTVTTEAAKAAKAFDDSMASLKKDLLDFARTVVPTVMAGVSTLIQGFMAVVEWRARLLAENDKRNAILQPKQDAYDLAYYNEVLKDTTLSLENRAGVEEKIAAIRKRQADAAAKEFRGPVRDQFAGLLKAIPDAPPLKVQDATEAQSEIQKLVEKYRQLFEAEMDVGRIDSELLKARSLLSDPKFANATAAQRQAVLDYAEGMHQLRAARDRDNEAIREALEHDKQLGEGLAEIAKQSEAAARAFAALEAATPTAQFDAQRKVVDDLTDRFNKGLIPSYERYIELVQTATGTTGDPAAKKAVTDMEQAVQDLGKSLDETLGQGLEAMLTGHFDSIGKLFQRMLEQMAVKALQANLMDSLFGATGAGGNRSGGGWIDMFIKAVGWGTKASGGPVAPWSLTQVNDQAGASGAEGFSAGGRDFLLTGSQGGRVTQAGGRAAAVVQVNIAAGVSRNEVAALIPALKAQIKAEMIAAMRRPGFWEGDTVATFNYPSAFVPQTASWGIQKAGVSFRSPMAGSLESIAFPGEFWRISILLPPGKMANGGAAEAFFARLAGGVDRVLVPYWMRLAPRGTMRGTPTLGVAAARGALSLTLTTTGVNDTLRAGDMIGIGGQMFQVFSDCAGAGTALTVPLVNRVRGNIAAGTAVVWQSPTVNCLVPSSSSQRSYEPAVATAMPIDLEEAA